EGMPLLRINKQVDCIQCIGVMVTEEDTYNLEVEELHNYFVGRSGVLVHNGAFDHSFESTVETPTTIYRVYVPKTGETVYVGKSIDPDRRWAQHLTREHPEWAGKGWHRLTPQPLALTVLAPVEQGRAAAAPRSRR